MLPVLLCLDERTPESLAKIVPTVLVDKQTGEEIVYGVSIPGLERQIATHNLNLVMKVLHQLGDDAPPMQKPPYADVSAYKETPLDVSIRFNAYWFYESRRTGQRADIEGTGYEELMKQSGH